MIRALIFDFDGLILDTETPEVTAWQQVYSRYGVEFPVLLWGQIVGGNGDVDFDPVAYLAGKTGLDIDPRLAGSDRRVSERQLVVFQSILPGVKDYLDSAKRLGLKLAIASSSTHEWVDNQLKAMGLFDHFDAILCSEEVQRVKPAPDLFLAALAALHVRADEALVFEDSSNGVKAARSAGVQVVAVPNPITALLGVNGADVTLTSLKDLPLEDLLLRFNVAIRQEEPCDVSGIRSVNRSAFPQDTEADLVDLIRTRRKITLSLVAANGDQVLGHVMFSPVKLEPAIPGLRGVGLGPVAVRPDVQGKGLGSRLVETGLDACRRDGYDFVVLLGDPRYYSRFGFLPASQFGLGNEYGVGDEFQVCELKPGVLKGLRALVSYVPEFKEVGC